MEFSCLLLEDGVGKSSSGIVTTSGTSSGFPSQLAACNSMTCFSKDLLHRGHCISCIGCGISEADGPAELFDWCDERLRDAPTLGLDEVGPPPPR